MIRRRGEIEKKIYGENKNTQLGNFFLHFFFSFHACVWSKVRFIALQRIGDCDGVRVPNCSHCRASLRSIEWSSNEQHSRNALHKLRTQTRSFWLFFFSLECNRCLFIEEILMRSMHSHICASVFIYNFPAFRLMNADDLGNTLAHYFYYASHRPMMAVLARV